MDSQLDPGFTTKSFPWQEKMGTSPLLSHARENLGTRTQFKRIGKEKYLFLPIERSGAEES